MSSRVIVVLHGNGAGVVTLRRGSSRVTLSFRGSFYTSEQPFVLLLLDQNGRQSPPLLSHGDIETVPLWYVGD